MTVRPPPDLESGLANDSDALPPAAIRVLLAHPQAITREGTRHILETEPGFEIVGETGSLAAAAALIEAVNPDVVLLGMGPAESESRTFLRALRNLLADRRVLVLESGVSPKRLSRLGISAWVGGTASPLELVTGLRAAAAGHAVFGNPTTISDDPVAPSNSQPTPRELEVLLLIEQGLNTRDIADRLRTTPRTVHFHVGNLFTKLGAKSRIEMIYVARRRGWLIS